VIKLVQDKDKPEPTASQFKSELEQFRGKNNVDTSIQKDISEELKFAKEHDLIPTRFKNTSNQMHQNYVIP
jgi:hypothetical protein